MAVTKTAVGTVDKKALEKLYNSFDTRRILDAIGDLDAVRAELEEPGGPRNDFFRLHEMAMYLINDDAPPGDGQAIWDLVDELSSKVFECREAMERVEAVLDDLQALTPDPDEYDYDEDEDDEKTDDEEDDDDEDEEDN